MRSNQDPGTKRPTIRNRNVLDNALLPHTGIPITEDDFIDSTERIVNATNTTDTRYDDSNDVLWNIDPGQFYDDSGLAGIDTAPNSSKKIDLGKFNVVFERNKELARQSQRVKDIKRLDELSQEKEHVSLYDLSLYQIIVNAKNRWFDLLDDVLDQRIGTDMITKDNRLFYIGLTILVFSTVLYLYVLIVAEPPRDQANVQKIYHIYQYPDPIHKMPSK
jgi:hypothetical protein